ncbi:DUF3826 domain-containing protein [Terrimonas pollutisoli]|uniref:DUF3826 domain-containing protein n=1 Tax=Terrimonas pollutisoli TaxID=3034147 RepID=UPI0023EB1BF2|nr:DUF3826 domain-containing protein [Terrimonas sp. H1YJ31]
MKRFMLASSNPVKRNLQFGLFAIVPGFDQRTNSHLYKKIFSIKAMLFVLAIACLQFSVVAQDSNDQQATYKKVVTERAAKIVNTLSLTDSRKHDKVLSLVANQYLELNAIHDNNKAAIDVIKKNTASKESAEILIKKQKAEKSEKLVKLHSAFIARLKDNLSDEQVEKIKDGMTYSILPITWKAYQDMLPNLTAEQKEKMYGWLVEARELAMDEGSSEKKHGVFGKYKGRINNYLSAAGYDMKKEGIEWQKRIKEREAAQKEAGNQK